MSACRVHSSILNLAYVILKYEELNATMLNFKLYVNRLWKCAFIDNSLVMLIMAVRVFIQQCIDWQFRHMNAN